MKAPPPALPAHVSTTAAASGAQEFRMPLGLNGLLPTQLFIGTVPWREAPSRAREYWFHGGLLCPHDSNAFRRCTSHGRDDYPGACF